MKHFQKISLIKNCTEEELFNFHMDSNNLLAITPPDTKVEMLSKDFQAKEGGVLKLKTIKFFIPTIWEVEIQNIEKPNKLVDFAIKSPFKYWKHIHLFKQKGDFVELRDEVYYELPLGKLGELANSFVIKELDNMFNYRHKKSIELLLSKKTIKN